MVTHPSRVLENISVSFLDANASLYWDNTFPVKPFNFKADASVFCIVIQINIKGTQIKYSTSGLTDTDTKTTINT